LKPIYDKLLSNFAFNFNLRRYTLVVLNVAPADAFGNPQDYALSADDSFTSVATLAPGRAVQVDPIKPNMN